MGAQGCLSGDQTPHGHVRVGFPPPSEHSLGLCVPQSAHPRHWGSPAGHAGSRAVTVRPVLGTTAVASAAQCCWGSHPPRWAVAAQTLPSLAGCSRGARCPCPAPRTPPRVGRGGGGCPPSASAWCPRGAGPARLSIRSHQRPSVRAWGCISVLVLPWVCELELLVEEQTPVTPKDPSRPPQPPFPSRGAAAGPPFSLRLLAGWHQGHV